jgi:hypothetical protein
MELLPFKFLTARTYSQSATTVVTAVVVLLVPLLSKRAKLAQKERNHQQQIAYPALLAKLARRVPSIAKPVNLENFHQLPNQRHVSHAREIY